MIVIQIMKMCFIRSIHLCPSRHDPVLMLTCPLWVIRAVDMGLHSPTRWWTMWFFTFPLLFLPVCGIVALLWGQTREQASFESSLGPCDPYTGPPDALSVLYPPHTANTPQNPQFRRCSDPLVCRHRNVALVRSLHFFPAMHFFPLTCWISNNPLLTL